MKQKLSEKYLEEIIHSDGATEPIKATIQDRHWRTWSAILEIKSVIEDCRSQAIGGLAAGIELWELAVIPMLLNNSGTWTKISDDLIKKLNGYQNKMLQMLFSVPRTTPSIALWWDVGTLLLEFRIKDRKLILAHHLTNLPDFALGRRVYDEQDKLGLPGLSQEISSLVIELDIPSVKKDEQTKQSWKNLVKSAVKKSPTPYF